MSYRLGVDLGTTFTAAAVANGGPPTMLWLGNQALQVPSVLYLPSDGDLVVGEAAQRRGLTDPSRVVREFKRRIGDHVPILVAGVPYSPQALTARLLRWVVRSSTDQMGAPPARTILTYPANWGPYKREILAQIVELADIGNVTTCSEPEAAAIQYAAKSRVPPGARIVMYDLGGGTFDTCVLEKRADGFVMLGESIGVEHLGGIDFDDALFQHVLAAVGDGASELDPADPQVQAGLVRLRRDCVDAKEALSADSQAIVPVALPGRSTSVRLTRAELEELIRPSLQDTVAAVGRAIRSARVDPSELHAIVLVGGGSRIPLVRELLQENYSVPTALDTHPKHDVALGAVQVDTESSGSASAGPATEIIDAAFGVHVPPPAEQAPARPPNPTPPPPSPTPPPPSLTPPPFSRIPPPSGPAPPPFDLTEPGNPQAARASDRAGRPGTRTVIIAFVIAALLLGALASLLTQGDDSSTAKPPPSAQLPASAPLTGQQLIVSMKLRGNTDLYLADAGVGAPTKRLTSAAGADLAPVLSPDRKSVIFVHLKKRRILRVMAADGTRERALFDRTPAECANVLHAGWNPTDPSMLALACQDKQGASGLYLVRIDGKMLREIPVGRPLVDDPTFSPDGRTLAYWASPQSPLDGGSIYTLPINADTPHRLTQVGPGVDADPAWSPDGKRIAFRRRVTGTAKDGNLDIYVVRSDGSQIARELVSGDYDDQEPSWSPTGDQIAITSTQVISENENGANDRVWLVKFDRSAPRLLWTSGADGEQSSPAWTRR
ncbi:MAG TPA: Hsp70 family protein [Kineosporiaceae bacterium]|nr:Hsp70 family protein [Kineosporiaceae bacterium]